MLLFCFLPRELRMHVIVDDGENVSLDRWAVNFMQMRYARGLLLNSLFYSSRRHIGLVTA